MLPTRRRNKQNKTAMFLIGFVLFMLVTVVLIKSSELREKRDYYAEKERQLDADIAYEEQRAEEIADYETYTQTKAYVEEVARDRLGLVYEGEILFKDEN